MLAGAIAQDLDTGGMNAARTMPVHQAPRGLVAVSSAAFSVRLAGAHTDTVTQRLSAGDSAQQSLQPEARGAGDAGSADAAGAAKARASSIESRTAMTPFTRCGMVLRAREVRAVPCRYSSAASLR